MKYIQSSFDSLESNHGWEENGMHMLFHYDSHSNPIIQKVQTSKSSLAFLVGWFGKHTMKLFSTIFGLLVAFIIRSWICCLHLRTLNWNCKGSNSCKMGTSNNLMSLRWVFLCASSKLLVHPAQHAQLQFCPFIKLIRIVNP